MGEPVVVRVVLADGSLAGWVAMPVPPNVDDAIDLPGLGPMLVTMRQWERMPTPTTRSLHDAGITDTGSRWVCTVFVGADLALCRGPGGDEPHGNG